MIFYTCRCVCPPNWYGSRCTIQYDDCNTGSATDLCGHGYCVNKPRTSANSVSIKGLFLGK